MRAHIHATALAALLISSSVQADPFPQSPPDKIGFSGERLQRIASALKSDVDKGRLPGAVVAIARKGQLAYFETVGFLDAERKVPMPRDAIFSLASMSKPMASIAIMMLIEEGRLFLSDPVGKFLPQLADMKVAVVKADAQGKATVETEPAKRQPTIQDLLRHTSGITYGGRGETPVHKLCALAFPNDPLTQKPQSVLHAGKPAKFDCRGACAAGTAMDYLRFGQMLANGGILDGKRIVSRAMLEMMTSDQLGPEVRARTTNPTLGEGYTFGLGFAVRQDTGLSPLAGSKGDYTWGGAYGTYFWVDPKEELVAVFMSAAPGEIRLYYRALLRNLVLQAITD